MLLRDRTRGRKIQCPNISVTSWRVSYINFYYYMAPGAFCGPGQRVSRLFGSSQSCVTRSHESRDSREITLYFKVLLEFRKLELPFTDRFRLEEPATAPQRHSNAFWINTSQAHAA